MEAESLGPRYPAPRLPVAHCRPPAGLRKSGAGSFSRLTALSLLYRRHLRDSPRVSELANGLAQPDLHEAKQMRSFADETRRANRCQPGTGVSGCLRESWMRVLGLAVAAILALSSTTAALADQQGKASAASRATSIGQAAGPGSRPHPAPGHAAQWAGGWHRPGWQPNRQYGGWTPYAGWGRPVYWVSGPSGGAFDYPFADWRGPTGGWGNP
jgi:hypothetical protein